MPETHIACPYCLKVQRTQSTARFVSCSSCGRKISFKQAELLSNLGYSIARFGWTYYIVYDGKELESPKRFSLPETSSFLWSLGAWAALQIAGGLSYDLFKVGTKILYAKYKNVRATRHHVIRDANATRMLPKLYKLAARHVQENPEDANKIRALRKYRLAPNQIERFSAGIEIIYRPSATKGGTGKASKRQKAQRAQRRKSR